MGRATAEEQTVQKTEVEQNVFECKYEEKLASYAFADD